MTAVGAVPEPTITARALLHELAGRFEGPLIGPRDARYDGARRIWNAMIDRRPALIAQPASMRDVVAAVGAARALGLQPAVRGGGHQVAGFALCHDGFVIDLSGMRAVEVDVERRRAFVAGGCLLGDLDRATQQHGLVTPAGAISHTGVAGLTLGGGIGWLCRRFGLTCDSMVAAEVVLADGSVAVASEDRDPDLLWALRGGGGNFGVVTRFEFQSYPLRTVTFAQAVHRLDDAASVLHGLREAMAGASDELLAVAALRRAPDIPVVPRELVGEPVVAVNQVWSGAPEDAEAALAPISALGRPVTTRVAEIPFLQLQSMQDDLHPHGLLVYMKSQYLADLSDAAVDALLEATRDVPEGMTQIELVHLRGAIARVPDEATAFPNRSAPWIVNIVATWADPAMTDTHIAWARRYHDALSVAGTGTAYLNFVAPEPDALVRTFGPEKHRRLVELKRRYDPDNLFRRNHNIDPRAGELQDT